MIAKILDDYINELIKWLINFKKEEMNILEKNALQELSKLAQFWNKWWQVM